MDTAMSSAIQWPRSLIYYHQAPMMFAILLVRLVWGLIRQPPCTSMWLSMWTSMVCAQVWRSTHMKLQHESIRNLNGARILMWHFTDNQVCFLTVVCTLWGTLGGTLWYLLWIWRETHGEKLIGQMVFTTPCIKLRVTYVYVLLMVPMIPSFQSRSLKTMVLIIGH